MRRRIEPNYRPSGAHDEIVLYAGDLAVKVDDAERTVAGQLELRLVATPGLAAHFAGPPSDDLYFVRSGQERMISVPAGAQLTPPTESSLPENPGDVDWLDDPITMNELEAGDASAAERFVIHISGALEAEFPPVGVVGGGHQCQLDFGLPGWDLVIAPVDDRGGKHDFGFVVEATPQSSRSSADVSKLVRRLFIMLSFMTSREVGVGPACGVSEAGEVIWARLGAPRMRPGRPGVRWCPRILVATAFPEIVNGFTELSKDEAMEAVVDRAIEHLLAADGSEAIDVRVPVACAGLEMLGWAALQRHGWAERDALEKMSAAAITRLLLQWAGVPATIPHGFDRLAVRRDSRHPGGGGPEVLWGVRNKLVHPPNLLDNLEWPSSEELIESWQLANWYLELVVLRVLDYDGKYWSRLRLGRYGADLEHVPWVAGCVAANSA